MGYLLKFSLVLFLAGFARAEAATYLASRNNSYQCRLPMKTDVMLDYARNPADMLRDLPNGGKNLAWRVRTVATASSEGLKIVGRVFRLANSSQKQAIGEGLARAATTCETLDSEVTTRIADTLRGSGDQEIISAFTRFLTNAEPDDVGIPSKPAEARRSLFEPLPSGAPIESAGEYFGSRIDTGSVR